MGFRSMSNYEFIHNQLIHDIKRVKKILQDNGCFDRVDSNKHPAPQWMVDLAKEFEDD